MRKINNKTFKGLPLSGGVVFGRVTIFDESSTRNIPQYNIEDKNIPQEIDRFLKSLDRTKKDIKNLYKKVKKNLGPIEADIFSVHLLILDDKKLIEDIKSYINKNNVNAETAVLRTFRNYEKRLEANEDTFVKDRALDLKDLANKIIGNLTSLHGEFICEVPDPNEKLIVIARNLVPSLTLQLKKERTLGFVTEKGGVNSHAAILSRAMEIPAVSGIDGITENVQCGDKILIDGNVGIVFLNPGKNVLQEYEDQLKHEVEIDIDYYSKEPAVTIDNVEYKIMANIGKITDIEIVNKYNADGIGLYRTEFPFMIRDNFPTEYEQFNIYKKIIAGVKPNIVTFRVLDIGGDKFLPYFNLSDNENPFLNLRGTKLLLDNPKIVKTQMRAILKASVYGNIRIMYPMVNDVDDIIEIQKIWDDTKKALDKKGIKYNKNIPQGAMIEVPSAVLMLTKILELIDFISIGTNDLLQYILAIDRNGSKVAKYYDPYHPALIQALKNITDIVNKTKKTVSICGEIAGYPELVPLFTALKIHELSMNPYRIPYVKKRILETNTQDSRKTLQKLMNANNAKEIKKILNVD